jgi:hypothetical protein
MDPTLAGKVFAQLHGQLGPNGDMVKTLFAQIAREGHEMEVARFEDPRNSWQFRSPHPLLTFSELRRRTVEILEDSSITLLHIVCETGQWLRRAEPWLQTALKRRPPNSAALVCQVVTVREDHFAPMAVSELHKWPWNSSQIALLDDDLAARPPSLMAINWWELSRHLTLGLSGNPQDPSSWRPSKGIFFRRRLNSPLTCPVYVETEEDASALEAFFQYYRRKCVKATLLICSLPDVHVRADMPGVVLPYLKQLEDLALDAEWTSITWLAALCRTNDESKPWLDVGVLGYEYRDGMWCVQAVAVRDGWRHCGVGAALLGAMEQRVRPAFGGTSESVVKVPVLGTSGTLSSSFFVKNGYRPAEDGVLRKRIGSS